MQFWSSIGSWITTALHSVPDVIWAALIAAGIAFLTSWISNRNSRLQVEMQLNHDAQQRDRERQMTMRRDVYMAGAEAVTRIQGSIALLTDVNADQLALSKQITADLGVLAKLNVVSTEATITAISRFISAALQLQLELTVERQPIVARHAAIMTYYSLRGEAIEQKKRIIELMREARIAGNADLDFLRRLQAQFEFEEKNYRDCTEKISQLEQQQARDQLQLLRHLLEGNERVVGCIPDALLAARRELELPIDENSLRRIFADQQATVREVMGRFFRQMGHPANAEAGAAAERPEAQQGSEQ